MIPQGAIFGKGDFALAGNGNARAALFQAAAGRPFHAYLITGPEGSGKGHLAKLLAQTLVCKSDSEKPCGICIPCRKVRQDIHPDVVTAFREGKKDFKVTQVRALRQDAYILPNEADYKVYILPDAAAMNPAAQNALLKLLEEPPAYVVLLLLSIRGEDLLPTVRSRCVSLAMEPLSPAELSWVLAKRRPDVPESARKQAAETAGKSAGGGFAGMALALLDEPSAAESAAAAICDALAQGDEYNLYKEFAKTEWFQPEDFRQTLAVLARLVRDAVLLKEGGAPMLPRYEESTGRLAAKVSSRRLQQIFQTALSLHGQSALFYFPGGNLPAAAAAALFNACRRTL